MTHYLPPKLPREFHGVECDVCGTSRKLKVIAQLLSDPPQPCEWRCEDCCKAVQDATAQKRYLRKYKKVKQ